MIELGIELEEGADIDTLRDASLRFSISNSDAAGQRSLAYFSRFASVYGAF
jgi:hypothetical protein